MTTTTGIIAREPAVFRRELLDDLASHDDAPRLVQVEHAYTRKLDDANFVVGLLLGVAETTWAGAITDPLIIHGDGELWAISAAHVLRIREFNHFTSEPGAILAGPPIEGVNYA